MKHELLRNIKITMISTAIAGSATTTPANMTVIDMLGFEGVSLLAQIAGTPTTAGWYFSAQGGTSSGGGDMVTLSSSAVFVSTGIDSGVVGINIFRPAQRYVRMVNVRQTTADAIDGAVALQYRAVAVPVTHSTATVYNVTYLVKPATGGAT